jgi:dephospho-CoA kinase
MSVVIGLTGGIASGKSTVSNMLKKKGITVIDADIESRLAVEPGEEAYNDIVNHFGATILLEDGSINRAKLGEIVFNQKSELKILNGIVHPAVRKRMQDKKKSAISRGESVVVLDIPLLFESKLTTMVDKTLLVFVDPAVQLERLMKRNKFSEQEARARISSQMPLQEKIYLADAVINNNGTVEQTEEQLNDILMKWGFEKEAN